MTKATNPNSSHMLEMAQTPRRNNDGDLPASRLLLLPAELRNTIYDYALSDNIFELGATSDQISLYPRTLYSLSLIFVNRQIHAEVFLHADRLNEFAFGSADALHDFHGHRSPEQLEVIQSVYMLTSYGLRMLNVGHRLRQRDVGYLSHLNGLQRVTIVVTCAPRGLANRALPGRLRSTARMIREWMPEVEIMAHRHDGKCIDMFNGLGGMTSVMVNAEG